MGCRGSKELDQVYPEEWLSIFEALQLTLDELIKLEKIFQEVDNSSDGRLDLSELLEYIGLKRTPFAVRVFSIFDADKSGEVDFKEFVLALWNFCACSDAALRIFAFDLYDADSSGKIEIKEIEFMLREVYGPGYESSSHASRLLGKMKGVSEKNNAHGTITLDQFAIFTKDNPAMLFPAFEMQKKIQKKIMGAKFWEKILDRRISITGDGSDYVSVKDLLRAKVSESTFKDLVERPMVEKTDLGSVHNTLEVHKHIVGALDNAGTRAMRKEKQGTDIVNSARPVGVPY